MRNEYDDLAYWVEAGLLTEQDLDTHDLHFGFTNPDQRAESIAFITPRIAINVLRAIAERFAAGITEPDPTLSVINRVLAGQAAEAAIIIGNMAAELEQA